MGKKADAATEVSEEELVADFAEFYKSYPRKPPGKPDALKAYKQARKKIARETILLTLSVHLRRRDWNRGLEFKKFIPYPATWLRSDPWDAEFEKGELMPEPKQQTDNKCPKCPHDKHENPVCGYCRIIARNNGEPFGCSQ